MNQNCIVSKHSNLNGRGSRVNIIKYVKYLHVNHTVLFIIRDYFVYYHILTKYLIEYLHCMGILPSI